MKKKFSYRHFVSFEDTNMVGNVYFSKYLSWQGKCREIFIREKVPELISEVEDGTLSLITLHCSCNYLSELRAFDEVIVEMSLDSIQQNRIRMSFEYHKICDTSNCIVANGLHEIGCFRRAAVGLETIPVPASLLNALELYK
jgi:enediyne biosynthesis thioesterase